MDKTFAELVLPVPLHRTYTYLIPSAMEVTLGDKVRVSFGSRILDAWVVEVHNRPCPPGIKPKTIEKKQSKKPLFSKSYLAMAEWIAGFYFCSLGEALESMLPGAKRSKPVQEEEELILPDDDLPVKKKLSLSQAQVDAISIITTMEQGMAYLFGVTGSGKTEVFLHCAEAILNKGKSVIYLVPEIALSTQLVDEIKERFIQGVAILHSRMTPSERLGEWYRIQDGTARLIIGARSAIFAPVQNLGLIIVDEEHENSYKSSSTPRYHARQVAMHRCASDNALLLLGSATPSIEAYHLMEVGKIKKILLPQRVSGGSMPPIEVVGIGGPHVLSPQLIDEMQKTSALKAQTVLFLNRRGFSHFAFCHNCGKEVMCKQCSVPMTYHKSREKMVCHYCGRSSPVPQACPSCGTKSMAFAGFGTEYVEAEVKRLFPHLRIARLDTDSVSHKGSLEATLQGFRRGEIDVLMGTQMVAKGLNFPNLRLVGIVLGDAGLHLPDFRSGERIFSLLTQVAGRAGRYRNDGKVIIQAAQPNHPIITMVKDAALKTFYETEIENRKLLGFPPFKRVVRLVFRSKSQDKARLSASQFAQIIKTSIKNLGEVMGPAECPLAQMNGSWRYHILLISDKFPGLHGLLGVILRDWQNPTGTYLEIDVDPSSML